MAARQPEIIRQLEDGFVVAWDTTEVPDDLRDSFEEAVSDVSASLLQTLRERESQPSERESSTRRRSRSARRSLAPGIACGCVSGVQADLIVFDFR